MTTTADIINIMSDSLQDLTGKLVGVIILATILGMIYKTIEKKFLSLVDKKLYERKAKEEQKKYEYLEQSNHQCHASQSEATEISPSGQIYEAQHGAWSPTGWIYDRDTLKWEPPEYLSEESRLKWEWDPEKKIWIDLDKKRRVERYQQYRREAGKEPTFEEWKTQKGKDKQE